MDMTGVTAAIDAVQANIELVGLAVIVVAAAVMAFRWVKAMFF